jgi:multiple sugar transport system permease protein
MVPFGRFTLNSLIVVTLAVPITLIISSWAGFGMARLPRPSQRRWLVLSLAVLMVPGIALWSTRFMIYRQLGWLDTIWSLIAPAWMGTNPFYVLMFYRAFRRIPSAIYDAARIDGAGVLQTWNNVALPMARPTVLGVALLTFIVYWGDFISPLLYLRDEAHYTLPVALQLLGQMNRSDWPLLMAAAVMATFVPVLLFLLAQPYFGRVGDQES